MGKPRGWLFFVGERFSRGGKQYLSNSPLPSCDRCGHIAGDWGLGTGDWVKSLFVYRFYHLLMS
ncbi:hypothetical protein JYQ62_05675 [Nostoc sp. UHCC 0702]|nr:hypothetical protein JYQ62_05675 [Nostoc sp. UHCC 0702]